ncbi:MAG: hypothetical protein ACTSVT_12055 [Candidatus Thorarchaeota archaeon]
MSEPCDPVQQDGSPKSLVAIPIVSPERHDWLRNECITASAYSNGRIYLAVGAQVYAVDVQTGTVVGTYKNPRKGTRAISADEHNLYVANGSKIDIVRLSDGEKAATLKGSRKGPRHKSDIISLTTGQGLLFSLDEMGTIIAWDQSQGTLIDDWNIKGAMALTASGPDIHVLIRTGSEGTLIHGLRISKARRIASLNTILLIKDLQAQSIAAVPHHLCLLDKTGQLVFTQTISKHTITTKPPYVLTQAI